MKFRTMNGLAALAGLLLAATTGGIHAAETFTRPAMAEAMATNCVLRGVGELAAGATNLSAATQSLLDHPDAKSLARAQRAWIELQLTYKRNQMLGHGPVKDPAFWASMFFPQAYVTAIENVINSPKPINADFIEVLGSSARGFYVIEFVLFEPVPRAGSDTNQPPVVKLLQSGPLAERRRLYVCELARDLEARLNAALVEARNPGFPARFAAGGADNINLLVNQVIDGIETGVVVPLSACITQPHAGIPRFGVIGGVASSVVVPSLNASLEGVRRFYLGGDGLGIDDYVRHVNPDLAARVEAQFKTLTTALVAVKTAPKEVIPPDRAAIEKALEEARKLEQLIKVDVVSAVGATVLFNANDGD